MPPSSAPISHQQRQEQSQTAIKSEDPIIHSILTPDNIHGSTPSESKEEYKARRAKDRRIASQKRRDDKAAAKTAAGQATSKQPSRPSSSASAPTTQPALPPNTNPESDHIKNTRRSPRKREARPSISSTPFTQRPPNPSPAKLDVQRLLRPEIPRAQSPQSSLPSTVYAVQPLLPTLPPRSPPSSLLSTQNINTLSPTQQQFADLSVDLTSIKGSLQLSPPLPPPQQPLLNTIRSPPSTQLESSRPSHHLSTGNERPHLQPRLTSSPPKDFSHASPYLQPNLKDRERSATSEPGDQPSQLNKPDHEFNDNNNDPSHDGWDYNENANVLGDDEDYSPSNHDASGGEEEPGYNRENHNADFGQLDTASQRSNNSTSQGQDRSQPLHTTSSVPARSSRLPASPSLQPTITISGSTVPETVAESSIETPLPSAQSRIRRTAFLTSVSTSVVDNSSEDEAHVDNGDTDNSDNDSLYEPNHDDAPYHHNDPPSSDEDVENDLDLGEPNVSSQAHLTAPTTDALAPHTGTRSHHTTVEDASEQEEPTLVRLTTSTPAMTQLTVDEPVSQAPDLQLTTVQPTVESAAEPAVENAEAAATEPVAANPETDPIEQTVFDAFVKAVPVIFGNLFYTFTGCTEALHTQQTTDAAESDISAKLLSRFITDICKKSNLPELSRHNWIWGHKPASKIQIKKEEDLPDQQFIDDLLADGTSAERIEQFSKEQLRSKAYKRHLRERDVSLLDQTTASQRSMLYCGRTCSNEPPIKIKIDDPVPLTSHIQEETIFDIDSISLEPTSIAVLQGLIHWLIAQPLQTGLADSRHLPKRQVWPNPPSPSDGRKKRYKAHIHQIPHLLFARQQNIELYIIFPHLYRSGEGAATKMQQWRVLKNDYTEWLTHIFIPALEKVLGKTLTDEYPHTYEHIKNMVHARHDQHSTGTNNQNTPQQQRMQYLLPEGCGDRLWQEIQVNIRNYQDDRFNGAFLFAHGKNLKCGLRTNSSSNWSDTMNAWDKFYAANLDPKYVGDEDNFYLDIGQHHLRVHSLPDDNPTVLIWRRCCLDSYIHALSVLDGGKARFKAKHYPYIQLGETGTLTVEPTLNSVLKKAGIAYIQHYPTCKNFFASGNVYPHVNPDKPTDTLAYDPQLIIAMRIAADNNRKINAVPIYLAGKRIITSGSDDCFFKRGALRSEYMITMTTFKLIRKLHQFIFDKTPLDKKDRAHSLLQSIADGIRALEKTRAQYAHPYFELSTTQFLQWVHWNINRFSYLFEALYSLHHKYGLSSTRIFIPPEHTKLMLAALHSLAFSYGSANPDAYPAYWLGERSSSTETVDRAVLVFDPDSEIGGQQSGTPLGLGVHDCLRKYGMAWFLPRINWETLEFLPEITERMLFSIYGPPSRRRVTNKPHQAVYEIQQTLEHVQRWYLEKGPSKTDRLPYLRNLCVYLRQSCMLEFRKYIFNRFDKLGLIREEYVARAQAGRLPLCWTTLQQALRSDAQPVPSCHGGQTYKTPELMFTLYWEDDEEHELHPNPKKAAQGLPLLFKRSNGWNDASFRMLFRKSCRLLETLFSPEIKTQWVDYFRTTMTRTCNAWPYVQSTAGTLPEIKGKRHPRFTMFWNANVMSAYLQDTPWARECEETFQWFTYESSLIPPLHIEFEDTHRWPINGWTIPPGTAPLPDIVGLETDDLSMLVNDELQSRLYTVSASEVPAVNSADDDLWSVPAELIPKTFYSKLTVEDRLTRQTPEVPLEKPEIPLQGPETQPQESRLSSERSETPPQAPSTRATQPRKAAPSTTKRANQREIISQPPQARPEKTAPRTIVQIVMPLRGRTATPQPSSPTEAIKSTASHRRPGRPPKKQASTLASPRRPERPSKK